RTRQHRATFPKTRKTSSCFEFVTVSSVRKISCTIPFAPSKCFSGIGEAVFQGEVPLSLERIMHARSAELASTENSASTSVISTSFYSALCRFLQRNLIVKAILLILFPDLVFCTENDPTDIYLSVNGDQELFGIF
uniref:Uncharacterized protein n=1 Tax=Parascaris univalens TaxID=6257 RepID=A0A915C5V1_PARUN